MSSTGTQQGATMPGAAGFRCIARGGAWHLRSRAAEALLEWDGGLLLGLSWNGDRKKDDRDAILRYDPLDAVWDPVWQSPLEDGQPRDQGVTALAMFQARDANEAAVYAATQATEGTVLLRSIDGRSFEEIGAPGLGGAGIQHVAALLAWGPRLVALCGPAPAADGESLVGDNSIFCSEDPAGPWHPLAPAGLAAAGNSGVTAIAVMDDCLYAGTRNEHYGFEIWRCDSGMRWERVLADGARRYVLNAAVTAMAPFAGHLYIGAGSGLVGLDTTSQAAELLRLSPAGEWDLICGSPRFSPQGLKIPLSSCSAGFDDPCNTAIAAISEHAGKLYLGTCHNGPADSDPLDREMDPGGFQLFSTADGEEWQQEVENGGGNYCCLGVRTLRSTSHGLAVGTLNLANSLQRIRKAREPRARPLSCSAGFEVWVGQAEE